MTQVADMVRFHRGPFHYGAISAEGMRQPNGEPFPPLVAAYLAKRRKRPETPAARALEMARADVTRTEGRGFYPATYRASVYAGAWEGADERGRLPRQSDRAYYADEWPAGFRLVGVADSILGSRNRGYYTDSDGCGGSFRGYVLQLPGRNGESRFVPGIAHTENCGVTVWPADIYSGDSRGGRWASTDEADEAKRDAARAADSYAEAAAERERDYNDSWQAGCEAGRLRAEARRERREAAEDAAHWTRVKFALVAGGMGTDSPDFREAQRKAADRVSVRLERAEGQESEADNLESRVPSRLADAFREGADAGAAHVA
jgi:hypothetical protein